MCHHNSNSNSNSNNARPFQPLPAIEYGKLFSITLQGGRVSADGERLIREYLGTLNVGLPYAEESFSWDTITPDGKLAKRIAKFAKKHYDIRLTPAQLGHIGSIVGNNTLSDSAQYHIDFNSTLDWSDGDFGDSGSCLWGGRESGRMAMIENGVNAVRFWNLPEDEEFDREDYQDTARGWGRAWVWKRRKFIVIWNSYGYENWVGRLHLARIARILGQLWGISYRPISLSNNGATDGQVYINSGRGYILGDIDDISEVSSYDLEICCADDTKCENCGCHIGEDDSYYTDDGEGPYCADCFNEMFAQCENCGYAISHEDVIQCYSRGAHGRTNTEYLCERCATRRGYRQCEDCGEYWDRDDMTQDYCPSCAENHVFCDNCGEEVENTIDTPDGALCEDCHSEKYPDTAPDSWHNCAQCDKLISHPHSLCGDCSCENMLTITGAPLSD